MNLSKKNTQYESFKVQETKAILAYFIKVFRTKVIKTSGKTKLSSQK